MQVLHVQGLHFNFRLTTAFIYIGLFQKTSKQGVGDWGMEFPRGIKEKACWNSTGQLKNTWNFQQWLKKIMWNFHRSWFFFLKFPRGATQLCGISKGEVFAFSKISKGKVTNPKIPGSFFKKVCPQPATLPSPRFDFFWNSTFKRMCLYMLRN